MDSKRKGQKEGSMCVCMCARVHVWRRECNWICWQQSFSFSLSYTSFLSFSIFINTSYFFNPSFKLTHPSYPSCFPSFYYPSSTWCRLLSCWKRRKHGPWAAHHASNGRASQVCTHAHPPRSPALGNISAAKMKSQYLGGCLNFWRGRNTLRFYQDEQDVRCCRASLMILDSNSKKYASKGIVICVFSLQS